MVPTPTFLVGGPPGAGKTTLARHLASDLAIPTITIDDIRTALLALTTPQSHPELHVVGLPDPWTYFTETRPEQQLEDGVTQNEALWPAVEKVIRKHARAGRSLVIDGWHLIPEIVQASNLDSVEAVWLDIDHDILRDREREVWDFYARSNDPDRMFDNFLARSTGWNDLMRDQATSAGYRVIQQDGSKTPESLAQEVLSR